MYQQSYAEVLEDDQTAARRIEFEALDHAVGLLRHASTRHHPSLEGVQALYFTRELWAALVSELAAPNNALSNELRGKLISIGIWIMKEADAIRLGNSTNYSGIADICAIVRDGLR